MDEGSLEIGRVVDERYTVEALVGLGGLAEVYKVRHVELGSLHALKLLTWNRKSLTDRLLLEGRIQAQLTHPHIVRVTDVLRIDSRVGLLLEFIEGPSLEEFLDHHGALSVTDALGLFAPVLAAVAHAHDAGVLHRDLKPGNVLLMRAPGGWIPKVTDFGLAKVVEEGLGPNTRTGISMGTPGYMPPEQVRNSASVDTRTDIFALGSVLYEMIAGKKAFASPEGSDIELTATIERTPPPLSGVGPDLEAALRRALERDREHRWPDARSFATALGIADHPSLASSPDLVRVALALDPSTYPSSPSGGALTASVPASALREPSRPTSGRWAVAAILGSVVLAVLVTALMTQPVLNRRARQASEEAAPPAPTSAEPDGGLEPLVPPEPVTPSVSPPSAAEPAEQDVPAAPVEAEAPVRPPEPQVLEVLPPPTALDTGDQAQTDEPRMMTVAASVPEVEESAPEPDETPLEADAAPPESEEASVEAGPPLAVGTYEGQADRRPFELRVTQVRGDRVVAAAAFFAGSGPPRVEALEGTFDANAGTLRLSSPNSRLVFEGRRENGVIDGRYMRGGRALTWRVSLP